MAADAQRSSENRAGRAPPKSAVLRLVAHFVPAQVAEWPDGWDDRRGCLGTFQPFPTAAAIAARRSAPLVSDTAAVDQRRSGRSAGAGTAADASGPTRPTLPVDEDDVDTPDITTEQHRPEDQYIRFLSLHGPRATPLALFVLLVNVAFLAFDLATDAPDADVYAAVCTSVLSAVAAAVAVIGEHGFRPSSIAMEDDELEYAWLVQRCRFAVSLIYIPMCGVFGWLIANTPAYTFYPEYMLAAALYSVFSGLPFATLVVVYPVMLALFIGGILVRVWLWWSPWQKLCFILVHGIMPLQICIVARDLDTRSRDRFAAVCNASRARMRYREHEGVARRVLRAVAPRSLLPRLEGPIGAALFSQEVLPRGIVGIVTVPSLSGWAASMVPMDAVRAINAIFGRFDGVLTWYERRTTIRRAAVCGDSYTFLHVGAAHVGGYAGSVHSARAGSSSSAVIATSRRPTPSSTATAGQRPLVSLMGSAATPTTPQQPAAQAAPPPPPGGAPGDLPYRELISLAYDLVAIADELRDARARDRALTDPAAAAAQVLSNNNPRASRRDGTSAGSRQRSGGGIGGIDPEALGGPLSDDPLSDGAMSFFNAARRSVLLGSSRYSASAAGGGGTSDHGRSPDGRGPTAAFDLQLCVAIGNGACYTGLHGEHGHLRYVVQGPGLADACSAHAAAQNAPDVGSDVVLSRRAVLDMLRRKHAHEGTSAGVASGVTSGGGSSAGDGTADSTFDSVAFVDPAPRATADASPPPPAPIRHPAAAGPGLSHAVLLRAGAGSLPTGHKLLPVASTADAPSPNAAAFRVVPVDANATGGEDDADGASGLGGSHVSEQDAAVGESFSLDGGEAATRGLTPQSDGGLAFAAGGISPQMLAPLPSAPAPPIRRRGSTDRGATPAFLHDLQLPSSRGLTPSRTNVGSDATPWSGDGDDDDAYDDFDGSVGDGSAMAAFVAAELGDAATRGAHRTWCGQFADSAVERAFRVAAARDGWQIAALTTLATNSGSLGAVVASAAAYPLLAATDRDTGEPVEPDDRGQALLAVAAGCFVASTTALSLLWVAAKWHTAAAAAATSSQAAPELVTAGDDTMTVPLSDVQDRPSKRDRFTAALARRTIQVHVTDVEGSEAPARDVIPDTRAQTMETLGLGGICTLGMVACALAGNGSMVGTDPMGLLQHYCVALLLAARWQPAPLKAGLIVFCVFVPALITLLALPRRSIGFRQQVLPTIAVAAALSCANSAIAWFLCRLARDQFDIERLSAVVHEASAIRVNFTHRLTRGMVPEHLLDAVIDRFSAVAAYAGGAVPAPPPTAHRAPSGAAASTQQQGSRKPPPPPPPPLSALRRPLQFLGPRAPGSFWQRCTLQPLQEMVSTYGELCCVALEFASPWRSPESRAAHSVPGRRRPPSNSSLGSASVTMGSGDLPCDRAAHPDMCEGTDAAAAGGDIADGGGAIPAAVEASLVLLDEVDDAVAAVPDAYLRVTAVLGDSVVIAGPIGEPVLKSLPASKTATDAAAATNVPTPLVASPTVPVPATKAGPSGAKDELNPRTEAEVFRKLVRREREAHVIAAAEGAIAVLRRLARRSQHSFVAGATVDSAIGCVVGDATTSMRYALFGVAPRNARRVIAAAPVAGSSSPVNHRSVAFATDAFRRMHDRRRIAEATSDVLDPPFGPSKPISLAESAQSDARTIDREAFTAPMSWRTATLGRCRMFGIQLPAMESSR